MASSNGSGKRAQGKQGEQALAQASLGQRIALLILAAVIVAVVARFFPQFIDTGADQDALPAQTPAAQVERGEDGATVGEAVLTAPSAASQSADDAYEVVTSSGVYASDLTFRSNRLLREHFEKHGLEMGFPNAEEYEAAARNVVANPDALHKLEAEDGDDVYYLEDSEEFVIVSTDGYIRTYYLASKDYFNRQ